MLGIHSEQVSKEFNGIKQEISKTRARWLCTVALGDGIAFLVFAMVGRASHHDTQHGPIIGAVLVAAPFLMGWYVAAIFTHAYSASMFLSRWQLVKHTFWALLVGDSIGLTLRSMGEDHITPLPFVLVAFATTSFLIVGWRLVVMVLRGERSIQKVTRTS